MMNGRFYTAELSCHSGIDKYSIDPIVSWWEIRMWHFIESLASKFSHVDVGYKATRCPASNRKHYVREIDPALISCSEENLSVVSGNLIVEVDASLTSRGINLTTAS